MVSGCVSIRNPASPVPLNFSIAESLCIMVPGDQPASGSGLQSSDALEYTPVRRQRLVAWGELGESFALCFRMLEHRRSTYFGILETNEITLARQAE